VKAELSTPPPVSKHEPNQHGNDIVDFVERVSGRVLRLVNSLLGCFVPGLNTNKRYAAADYYIFFHDVSDPNREPDDDVGITDRVMADDRDCGAFGYVGKLTAGQAQIARKRLKREFENALEMESKKSGINSTADSETSASSPEHEPFIGIVSLSEIIDIWRQAGQSSYEDPPKSVESLLQSFI
jgi:hypothetical protein